MAWKPANVDTEQHAVLLPDVGIVDLASGEIVREMGAREGRSMDTLISRGIHAVAQGKIWKGRESAYKAIIGRMLRDHDVEKAMGGAGKAAIIRSNTGAKAKDAEAVDAWLTAVEASPRAIRRILREAVREFDPGALADIAEEERLADVSTVITPARPYEYVQFYPAADNAAPLPIIDRRDLDAYMNGEPE